MKFLLPLCPRSLFPVLDNFLHILGCPDNQLLDNGNQRVTALGNGIFDAGRHFGIGLAFDETVGFKRFERGCKHLLGNVGNAAMEFLEAGLVFLV